MEAKKKFPSKWTNGIDKCSSYVCFMWCVRVCPCVLCKIHFAFKCLFVKWMYSIVKFCIQNPSVVSVRTLLASTHPCISNSAWENKMRRRFYILKKYTPRTIHVTCMPLNGVMIVVMLLTRFFSYFSLSLSIVAIAHREVRKFSYCIMHGKPQHRAFMKNYFKQMVLNNDQSI